MPEAPTPRPITGRRRIWLPVVAVCLAAVAIGILVWALLGDRPLSYRLEDPASEQARSELTETVAARIQELQKKAATEVGVPDSDPSLERLQLIWAIEIFRLSQGKFPQDIRTLAAAGLLPDTRLIDKYAFEVSDGRWKLSDRETDRTIAAGN